MRMHIDDNHEWAGRMIKEVSIPTGSLALMLKRGSQTIITRGDTRSEAGDHLILSVPPYTTSETEHLQERYISRADAWCNKRIEELNLSQDSLIAMIMRGDETIIPDGKVVIKEKDVVVMYQESV